jgi:GntR family transcriptional regulator, rspAB operon transcriptional repressor
MATSADQQLNPLQVKELVYAKLRQAIIDQTFAAGEPLREAALSERYGVSKTPIREALVRLQQDGLVEIAPYRGARAKRYTRSDLHEIYAAREILEAECVRRAAAAGDPATLAALRENVARTAGSLEAGDLDDVSAALDDFDAILFAQLDNSLLEDIRLRLSAHMQRIGQFGGGEARYGASLDQHRQILAAIEAGDPVEADRVLRGHLHSVRETQLAALGDVED